MIKFDFFKIKYKHLQIQIDIIYLYFENNKFLQGQITRLSTHVNTEL